MSFGPGRRARLRLVERVPAEYEAASRTAIFELARRMETAWGAGDGLAYAAVFMPDADYVGSDGTHLRGRDAIARYHQRLFDSLFAGSRLVHEGHASVRFLADEVAIVHWMSTVALPGERRPSPSRRSSHTLVALRSSEGWRVSALQVTRHRPRGMPSGWRLALAIHAQRALGCLGGLFSRGLR